MALPFCMALRWSHAWTTCACVLAVRAVEIFVFCSLARAFWLSRLVFFFCIFALLLAHASLPRLPLEFLSSSARARAESVINARQRVASEVERTGAVRRAARVPHPGVFASKPSLDAVNDVFWRTQFRLQNVI
jgi:hypothetical protein